MAIIIIITNYKSELLYWNMIYNKFITRQHLLISWNVFNWNLIDNEPKKAIVNSFVCYRVLYSFIFK